MAAQVEDLRRASGAGNDPPSASLASWLPLPSVLAASLAAFAAPLAAGDRRRAGPFVGSNLGSFFGRGL
jgi:hypothetical protein